MIDTPTQLFDAVVILAVDLLRADQLEKLILNGARLSEDMDALLHLRTDTAHARAKAAETGRLTEIAR
ncbi:hypothetical protein [Bradyrhizobium cytisi]|uniref:Uncharacterized protein n=1 Tax=Bradyrhizobium cytisi TaxID=515489 RepID=A0A5S4VX25_9BRAD|nr:hypothetical protein [Bradyrhizobium cytisi]TYL70263.1 hypothetical protein FXB38_41870 [Bradyrhizobium cytisi]